MRTLRNIFAIIALLSAASCAVDNVDAPSHGVNSSDVVTVLGRMTRFDDKDVTTRGVKDENEAKLTSMAVAIFPVKKDGTALDGNCVYWQYTDNQAELLFEINRSVSGFAQNARYAMYVFCNMPELEDFGIGTTLETMLTTAQKVSGINIPEKGFPMMGSLGDTFSTAFDRDNQELILSPTKNNELLAPTVDGDTQTLLTIPMKAMFAKVNFSIEVRPDQTIEGHYSPQFELKGYKVKNVPSEVDFSKGTNSDSEVLSSDCTLGVSGNNVASGANKINFTFYLPERLLTADKSLDSVLPANLKKKDVDYYDESVDSNKNGYRDEDEVYHQRFKFKMLGDNQKATNIVLSGQFRDHQNHYWDVDYTIYLGENNSTDFNIKRNSEYNNYVTIRGIQSSDDMSDNPNGIAIDHRVNVERTQPAIISLRREVLLDSHFEVRPLRIRKSDVANIPKDITHVKVEVVNPATTNWMRLERSFGDGTPENSHTVQVNGATTSIYIDSDANSPSYGKRKFFTFDLITGNRTATLGDVAPLTDSTSVVVPLSTSDECVWIYVDECTEVGDEVRAGIVKVTYGSYDGKDFKPANNATYPDVNYVINQRKLFQVKYDDPSTTTDENRNYHIEFEEEYLHNFDADDNYGQTEYEGMQWGLPGIQLSYDNDALYFDSSGGLVDGFFTLIINWIKRNAGVNPQYDFYIPKHDTSVSSQAKKRDFRGYVFSSEIIQVVNGQGNHDTDDSNNIDVLQLDEKPDSAIEYCYNKNKRNRNGQVAWTGNSDNLNWYLPAIDEIEDIVMSKYGENNTQYTYARFIEFQSQYYWSSQPSYIRNHAYYNIWGAVKRGKYYIDDDSHARSTSVSYNVNTQKFDYVLSGTTSDYNGIGIGGYNPLDPDVTPYTSGTFDGVVLGTIVREPGNQPRTEKNRIRCVRKSQYTNTKVD